jgi:hypothetical protein
MQRASRKAATWSQALRYVVNVAGALFAAQKCRSNASRQATGIECAGRVVAVRPVPRASDPSRTDDAVYRRWTQARPAQLPLSVHLSTKHVGP